MPWFNAGTVWRKILSEESKDTWFGFQRLLWLAFSIVSLMFAKHLETLGSHFSQAARTTTLTLSSPLPGMPRESMFHGLQGPLGSLGGIWWPFYYTLSDSLMMGRALIDCWDTLKRTVCLRKIEAFGSRYYSMAAWFWLFLSDCWRAQSIYRLSAHFPRKSQHHYFQSSCGLKFPNLRYATDWVIQ